MLVLTSDYIIEQEVLDAVDRYQDMATKASKKIATSIKTAFQNFTIQIGNAKIIDKRVLPFICQEFLYLNAKKCNFTDLKDSVLISDFMNTVGIPGLKFVPVDMVVYSRSDKDYPVLVRLNSKLTSMIKEGKMLQYLGYRKIGIKYRAKGDDLYFDQIISVENKTCDKVYYFGVWDNATY